MSETRTSIGPGASVGSPGDTSPGQSGAHDLSEPVRRNPRLRVGWMVAGISLCVLAAIMIAGGGWALWMDRLERDESGFLSIATTRLDTSSYAIVGDLWGDGPRWLYGSTV